MHVNASRPLFFKPSHSGRIWKIRWEHSSLSCSSSSSSVLSDEFLFCQQEQTVPIVLLLLFFSASLGCESECQEEDDYLENPIQSVVSHLFNLFVVMSSAPVSIPICHLFNYRYFFFFVLRAMRTDGRTDRRINTSILLGVQKADGRRSTGGVGVLITISDFLVHFLASGRKPVSTKS